MTRKEAISILEEDYDVYSDIDNVLLENALNIEIIDEEEE